MTIVYVDAPCDDIMDDIASEGHRIRLINLDTHAQARRNSRSRHTQWRILLLGPMEFDRRLIGLLRAIMEGDIVDVDLGDHEHIFIEPFFPFMLT